MSLLGFLFGRRRPTRHVGSILSDRTDHYNFFYGFAPGDYRQINVRFEGPDWVAYVGGEPVGRYPSKDQAEAGAIAYIEANPEPIDGDQ